MLKISVDHKKQYICTADGRKMRVFSAYAKVGKRKIPLQDCRGTKDSDVQIVFKRGIFFRKLQLPPEIKEGITEFLGEYSRGREDWFDCYAFVNLTFNIPIHNQKYLLRFWDLVPLYAEPRVGQAVFLLTNEHQRFHHAAVYIGFGLYVSVYGANGDLEFSTLKDMMQDYNAADCMLAVPRPQPRRLFTA